MKKQFISMLLTLAMLLSSVAAVPVFAAEPETYPDTLSFTFDGLKIWTLLENTEGYKENWTSSQGISSKVVFEDEHGEVYPIREKDTNPKLNLNYSVTGGKYVLAFDYYLPGDTTPRDFAVKVVDKDASGDTAYVEMYIHHDNFYSVKNSTAWEHNPILTPERDKWYNIALLFDIDNNEVHYYIDGVWCDKQSSTITEIDQFYFQTDYASAEKKLGYMDNVVAGYALNANLTFPAGKISPSDVISFNADYSVSEASLSKIKFLNASGEETDFIANLTNGGKTVNIVPVNPLTAESTYTVDVTGLKSIFETPYIGEKTFTVQTDKSYNFDKFDFNDYYFVGYTWGSNINKYSSSWSAYNDGGQGEAYSDDGHRYVYKFGKANTNLCYTSDHEITSGKYVYSFDWLSKSNDTTAADYCNIALTEYSNPNSTGSNKVARFENGRTRFLYQNWNVNYSAANTIQYDLGDEWNKWHKYTFVVDMDNNKITSYVDGEKVNELNATIPSYGTLKFNRSSNSMVLAYMDNFNAGYAKDAGVSVSDYLTTDGCVKITGDIPFDAETLNNVILKDNDGNVISKEIYRLDGNSEFYVVSTEAVSADKTYTLDISGVKSVAGERYKNKVFTLSVMTEDIDTGFEDLSTSSWYVVPEGFSGSESGKMDEKWLANSDGVWSRVYYTQNVDYVAGDRALKKTFSTPLSSGKVVFAAEYYSFDEGSTVRIDIVDSKNSSKHLVEFTTENKIITRDNNYTTDGIQTTAVEFGTYTQCEWQKVKAFIDLDKDLLTLYINGEKALEQSTRFDDIKTIIFNPTTNYTNKHYALDNVEIKYAGVPAATVARSVSTESGSIRVKFNNVISKASVENVKLLAMDETEVTLTKKELSANGKELTLSFAPGLVLGDAYTVVLDGVCDMFGMEVSDDAVFTVVAPVTTYSELTAAGTVVSSTVTNDAEISGSAYIIVAGYLDDELKVVDYEPVSFTAEDATKVLSFNYSGRIDLSGCDSAKAFLWNNFTDLIPLADVLPLEI